MSTIETNRSWTHFRVDRRNARYCLRENVSIGRGLAQRAHIADKETVAS